VPRAGGWGCCSSGYLMLSCLGAWAADRDGSGGVGRRCRTCRGRWPPVRELCSGAAGRTVGHFRGCLVSTLPGTTENRHRRVFDDGVNEETTGEQRAAAVRGRQLGAHARASPPHFAGHPGDASQPAYAVSWQTSPDYRTLARKGRALTTRVRAVSCRRARSGGRPHGRRCVGPVAQPRPRCGRRRRWLGDRW